MKTILINTNDFLNISSTKYDIEKIKMLTNIKSKDKINSLIEFIDKILSNLEEYYSDKYPKSTYYKYNDKVYFELDFKYNVTRCKYSDFWQKFRTDFGLNDMEIKELTQYMLGIHLKRKVPATFKDFALYNIKLGIHLKRKVPATGWS